MKKISTSLCILAISISLSPVSFAGNVTKNNKATATISSSCRFTIPNMNFGEVIPGQTSSSATSTLSVTCSKSLAYQYYANFTQIGTDCIFMAGATKGGKLYYDIISNGKWLRPVQYNDATSGGVSSVGTGANQDFVWTGYIQPSAAQGYPFITGCSAVYTGVGGINPYVAPDAYSDTVTAGIVF